MQWDHYFIGKTIPNSQIMILQAKITYFLLIWNLYSEQFTQKTCIIVIHTNTTHNYVLIQTEEVEETETLQWHKFTNATCQSISLVSTGV